MKSICLLRAVNVGGRQVKMDQLRAMADDLGFKEAKTLLASGNLAAELHRALGTAWDEVLEPYRCGGDGAEVTWLRRNVG